LAVPARDPLLGQVVADRYRLGPSLGRGGMAEVREATDLRLQRAVAVKFLDPSLASQPELRMRFEDEARSAARLNHPAVVQVFDSGEWEGRPYLVMELLSGRTLAAELAEGPLPLARVRAVAADVLGALAAAHAAGIIHRDVKPANLLLTDDGSVKVSDFGIAKADPLLGAGEDRGPAPTIAGQVLGTPAYLSPERLAGHPATPASDVWSVGVVCWEALAGHRAYPDGAPITVAMAVMSTDLPPVTSVRPDTDAALARAVDGALRRDPADRWPSASTMREVLLTGTTAWRPPPVARPAGAADTAATTALPYTTVLSAQQRAQQRVEPTPGLGRGRVALLAILAIVLLGAIAAIATVLLRDRGTSGGGSGSSAVTVTTTPPTTAAATTTTRPTPTTRETTPPTSTTTTSPPPTSTTRAPTTTTPAPPTTAQGPGLTLKFP